MPWARPSLAAPDVAGADDDGDLDAQIAQPADLASDDVGLVRVDAEAAFAGQGFAAQLEQDATIAQRAHQSAHSPTSRRAKRRTTMFSPSLAILPVIRSLILTLSSLMKGCSSRQFSS